MLLEERYVESVRESFRASLTATLSGPLLLINSPTQSSVNLPYASLQEPLSDSTPDTLNFSPSSSSRCLVSFLSHKTGISRTQCIDSDYELMSTC